MNSITTPPLLTITYSIGEHVQISLLLNTSNRSASQHGGSKKGSKKVSFGGEFHEALPIGHTILNQKESIHPGPLDGKASSQGTKLGWIPFREDFRDSERVCKAH